MHAICVGGFDTHTHTGFDTIGLLYCWSLDCWIWDAGVWDLGNVGVWMFGVLVLDLLCWDVWICCLCLGLCFGLWTVVVV